MFDGLYAMAMDDLRQCAVEDIRDAAFNAGQPLHVDPVYETGACRVCVCVCRGSQAAAVRS